jgi:hypothetical protein
MPENSALTGESFDLDKRCIHMGMTDSGNRLICIRATGGNHRSQPHFFRPQIGRCLPVWVKREHV